MKKRLITPLTLVRSVRKLFDMVTDLQEGGTEGPKGDPGKDGAKGETGAPGKDGAKGAKGDPGKDGADGFPTEAQWNALVQRVEDLEG